MASPRRGHHVGPTVAGELVETLGDIPDVHREPSCPGPMRNCPRWGSMTS